MTQDIGTAILRTKDYPDLSKAIYTVGDEQNYHFKVLFLILKKLGYKWADACEHLSYGMVELPSGKMKSREGTVVDADDLLEEMYATARKKAEELGKLEGLSDQEQKELFRLIGLGALKYFILRVDPKKQIIFNPEESIDFNGNTGPFIQYTHARIRSVIRKADELGIIYSALENCDVNDKEKSLMKLIYDFPAVIEEAGNNYSPALIANYVYELAREYNQFYHEYQILKEEDESIRRFRINLSKVTGSVIKKSMSLLGIEVPERM
jgi:arginyl-tRNA synthetase